MRYDKVIIGAGLYGLYAAHRCGLKKETVLVIECDEDAFSRATYVNQARVHMGYHYPRSYSTAVKSANYFNRFCEDYPFCINEGFDQVYATSAKFSWTNQKQFKRFCQNAKIRCDILNPDTYFQSKKCDGAFMTKEYTYDAELLKSYFLKEIANLATVEIRYQCKAEKIALKGKGYEIILNTKEEVLTSFVLNATYASINQINHLAGFEPLKIKYELCEIILCEVNGDLKNTGITVMDGPFFSIMPFGKTGYHSLTSVAFTPHAVSYDAYPTFECQKNNPHCTPQCLDNCNRCPAHPESAWSYMSSLASKYLKDEYEFKYVGSLYSTKPILMASEMDDSRPTVIKEFSKDPTFCSVLSGKINTVYDLDEVLDHD